VTAGEAIPYGRHEIDEADIEAMLGVLLGDWLTTGPAVGAFERAFADFTGASHAVAVSNGTAALHLAMLAANIGPGDEVIVPALTFAASANCVCYVGATVVFADVDPHTLTVDVAHAASLITPRTRALVAVDYAGLPADLTALRALADRHGLVFVEDGCHAPGATCDGRAVGTVADFTTFSFHPVKHITTAEGGMITTASESLASTLRTLRNHRPSPARCTGHLGVRHGGAGVQLPAQRPPVCAGHQSAAEAAAVDRPASGAGGALSRSTLVGRLLAAAVGAGESDARVSSLSRAGGQRTSRTASSAPV
jgi:dTDP-4-amino-4,6-dideoxygalactose transaminase